MAPMDPVARAFWDSLAKVPPGRILVEPVAPSAEDIGLLEARLRVLAAEAGRPLRALMLGATRAIAEMRLPEEASLLAADWSIGMLRHWWRARPSSGLRAAVLSEWRRLPLPGASQDVALGDGCYAALTSFDDCLAVNAEVRRVLRRDGVFLLRCFVRPETPEPLDALFAELFAGRIGVPEAFYWRLAMALHGGSRRGVRRDDVWQVWDARVGDRAALLAHLGWPPAALTQVERWRGSQVPLPFPTLAELRELVAPCFETVECTFPGYELGERCARLVLRARG